MTTAIFINNIEKETEKAMLISVNVSYNGNTPKARSMWFPKSVVESINGNLAEIKDWFISKTSKANAFKGYEMRFEMPF